MFTRTRTALFVTLLASALSTGCATTKEPGTYPYEPISSIESKALKSARKELYPREVFATPEEFLGEHVAWAGIIESYEEREIEGTDFVAFTAQHRHFDWQQVVGPLPEMYFPSTQGEGRFRIIWPVPPGIRGRVEEFTKVGDMIIGYGPIIEVTDGVIGIHPADYVRYISSEFYDDAGLDYGRGQSAPD